MWLIKPEQWEDQFEWKTITICAAFFMQRVCLDRQRHNPLIDRKIRSSILLMGKLNAYQKRQILISFSIQTLSHTFINNLLVKFNPLLHSGRFFKKTELIPKIDFSGILKPMGGIEGPLYGSSFFKVVLEMTKGLSRNSCPKWPLSLVIPQNMFFSPECQGMSLSKKVSMRDGWAIHGTYHCYATVCDRSE
jgi:hypothetical protein